MASQSANMQLNPNLSKLQPYPFQKLTQLLQGIQAPTNLEPIALSIGEPKHPTPEFIKQALTNSLSTLANYPQTRGSEQLRASCARWLESRFNLTDASVDEHSQVLPVNGTREALFAITQCIINSKQNPKAITLLPNPFYQIYEGASLLAGAIPEYMHCLAENNFIPNFDLPESTWASCRILYLCSPANPTGAVTPISVLKKLIKLAQQYNFYIISDECYSEIYKDEANPPSGLLQACQAVGNANYKNCLVFHSLSKRSNVPGLRSGFVAGDSDVINAFHLYRTYHGCAMAPPTQAASIAAWNDETHVIENRRLYREKFEMALSLLQPHTQCTYPEGGFYLWLKTAVDDSQFCQLLYEKQNIIALPGSFLSRSDNDINPGKNRIRLALVAPFEVCQTALQRLTKFIEQKQYFA